MDEIITEIIPVRKLANGDELNIKVYSIKGSGNGPSAYLQANLHGAEVQGNLVLFKLLEFLKENSPLGNITIVPNANPFGMNQKMGEYTFGRFDPVTGDNYNRLYWDLSIGVETFIDKNWEQSDETIIKGFFSYLERKIIDNFEAIKKNGCDYGKKLCLRLQEMANQHHIVLDLHTASLAVEHLYAPSYTLENAKYLGIKNIIVTQPEFSGAMDEACFSPWVKLKNILFEKYNREFKIPVEAFTVECGSQEILNDELAESQFKRILNYLTHRKVFSGTKEAFEDFYIGDVNQYHGIYAQNGGLYQTIKNVGDRVKEGDLLGYLIRNNTKFAVKSPYQGCLINQFASAIVHEGCELYRILIVD